MRLKGVWKRGRRGLPRVKIVDLNLGGVQTLKYRGREEPCNALGSVGQ
jgi:hypothetical protein